MKLLDKLRKAARWLRRKTTVGDYKLRLKAAWIDNTKTEFHYPRKGKP